MAIAHAEPGGIAVQRRRTPSAAYLAKKRTMTSNMRSRCPADRVHSACQDESSVRAQTWVATTLPPAATGEEDCELSRVHEPFPSTGEAPTGVACKV